jgi:hypothetical protein
MIARGGASATMSCCRRTHRRRNSRSQEYLLTACELDAANSADSKTKHLVRAIACGTTDSRISAHLARSRCSRSGGEDDTASRTRCFPGRER